MQNKFKTKGIIHSSTFPYLTSPQGRFQMKPFNPLFSLYPKQKQSLTDAAPWGGVSPRRAPQLLQGQAALWLWALSRVTTLGSLARLLSSEYPQLWVAACCQVPSGPVLAVGFLAPGMGTRSPFAGRLAGAALPRRAGGLAPSRPGRPPTDACRRWRLSGPLCQRGHLFRASLRPHSRPAVRWLQQRSWERPVSPQNIQIARDRDCCSLFTPLSIFSRKRLFDYIFS